MTLAGLLVDLAALALVGALVFLGQRRGGLRAGLDLGALVLTVVVLPMLTAPIVDAGGGLLAMGLAALVLMVGAILASSWLGRKLGSRPAGEQQPELRGSSRTVGGLVGLVTGVVIVASGGMLLVTMRLTSPALAPVTDGSLCVRGAAALEPTVRRILFESEIPPPPPPPPRTNGGSVNGGSVNGGSVNGGSVNGGTGEVSPGPGPDIEPAVDPARVGSVARVEALAELHSIQAITDDPALMEAIEQGNYSVMLNHPKLLELWQDARFRNFIAHVDTAQLVADSEEMKQLANDYEAALVAFQAGDNEAALAAAERVVATDPSYGRVLVLQGQIQKALGQLQEAALSWQEASDIYATAAEPPYLLGDLAADRQQFAQAIASYTESIERNPEFHYAIHNRGILLYETGNYLPAIADLRRALGIHPDDAALRASLDGALANLAGQSNALIASSRQDRELWPALLEWHSQLARVVPDEPMARNALALVLYIGVVEQELTEHMDEAIAAVDSALELTGGSDDPAHREHLAWKGILLLRAGHAGEAVAIVRPVLEEGRIPLVYSADIFTELAMHHAKKGELDRARRLFGVAVGALQGTSYPTRFLQEKYERVDPGAEIPPRDELQEFVPGLRYVFRSAGAEIEYAPAEGADSDAEVARLEPGDVLLEIDFVAPLWASEIRELLVQALEDPPVTLTVERDGDPVEIAIVDGCRHLEWDMAWPFALPDETP